MNRKNIDEKVNRTLLSLKNMKELEPDPFLGQRLKSRLNDESLVYESKYPGFAFKPAFLVIVLLINIVTGIFFFTRQSDNNDQLIETVSDDYKINQTTYEYLGLN